MNSPGVIVSCCYSEGRPGYYEKYADRLEASLDRHALGIDRIIWRNGWPPGSPSHSKVHYAFKYWAMLDAFKKGYQYAIWLDAGTELIAPIKPLTDKVEHDGHVLLSGGDPLGKWISDAALARFEVSRDKAMTMKLAGGCLVGLDLRFGHSNFFFSEWGQLAREGKLFMCHHTEQSLQDGGIMRSILRSDGDNTVISTDPRVEGHRSDEACFSLMMDKLGMTGIPLTEWQKIARTY